MAASEVEVAVSLAIVRLHDLLHAYKDIIIYPNLADRISDSISKLQRILNTSTHAELNDDRNREQLRLLARTAEEMEESLVQSFGDLPSKLRKGRLAKVLALVRFFSATNRVRAWEKMAKDFMRTVRSLSGELASPPPSAKEGRSDNKRVTSSSSKGRNRENTRQRVESDIVGRDKHVKKLLAWLIDPESDLRVISVVGEQHRGKTALVRSVFNKLEIRSHFDCRAWLHITCPGAESYWMKNLLVDILKQTPVRDQSKDLDHKEKEQLFEMLQKSLMEHRYLIVLDNWGDAEFFSELLVPFVDTNNGSRVIVTTRNEEIRKFADPWTPDPQLLPDLNDKECEDLLHVSITGGGNSFDEDLQSKMAYTGEILSNCNRSPPAISLLGGLLSTVEMSDWAALLKRLKNRPASEDVLDHVMCLSFDELPCMMKLRALYMALYPEEYEVPTRRLFRQWAAEGLLADAADGSEQTLSAEDCLRELERRNLICVVRRKLDGSARSCRMPAFLHEFCHQKAEEFGLLSIEEESRVMVPNAELNVQHQQVRMQTPVKGHYSRQVQCLRSFALFNTSKPGTRGKDIVDLLRSSQNFVNSPLLDGRPHLLRQLDLEGVYKPGLPEDFGNTLSNLRYLGLRWTVLDSIPESVGNLLLLETLDLKHTNITKVTSAIWNAKNLRHLYLSDASFDKSVPGHVSSGSKLETLWGLFIATADSPMIPVLKKLKSLKKLGVTCSPGAVKAVKKNVSNLTRLESLRLRLRHPLGQPAKLDLSEMKWPKYLSNLYLLGSLPEVKGLPWVLQNLKVLTLSMSGLTDDPMGDLGRLKNLTVLRLLARSFTGKSLCCAAGFPKLCILKLWKIEDLESLVVEKGAMRELKELEIRRCGNLKNVDGLEHIGSLEIVSLTGVKKKLADNVKVRRDNVNAKELIPEEKSQQKTDEH